MIAEQATTRAVSRVVVKVGSSSLTTQGGEIDAALINRLCEEIARLRREGAEVVVVTSGAIAAGWWALGRSGPRPNDTSLLQAVSAIGQPALMRCWHDGL